MQDWQCEGAIRQTRLLEYCYPRVTYDRVPSEIN